MTPLVAAIALSIGTANNSGTYDFATVGIPETLAFLVSNTGSTAAANLTVSFTLGLSFKVVDNRCPSTLAAGGKCHVLVEHTPVAVLGATDTINVNSTSGLGTTAVITGAAKGSQGSFSLIGFSDMGTLEAGYSTSGTFRFYNTSGSSRTISAVGLMLGTTFGKISDECTGKTIVDGAGCDIGVSFAAGSAGTFTDALYVNFSNSGPRGHAMTISGVGTAPILSLSGSGSFGSLSVGQYLRQAYLLTNTGTTEARGVTATLGPGTPEFSMESSTCINNRLMPGGSCFFQILLSPIMAGSPAGIVNFTAANVTLADLPLTATVLAPSLSVGGGTGAFGTVLPLSINTQTYTVTNAGPGSASAFQVYLSNPTNEFTVTSSDCPWLAPFSSGASCSVTVQFLPATDGYFTNSLVVYANGAAATQKALTGTALSK